MSKRLMLSAALATLVAGSFVPTASAFNLKTQTGYRELGGRIALDFKSVFPQGDGAETLKSGQFHLGPTFGIFVVDNLELLALFDLVLPFGEGTEDADGFQLQRTTVDVAIGLRYCFSLGSSVKPYIGAQIGMGFKVPDNPKLSTDKTFDIGGMIGILIPLLAENIALDLGMRLVYHISLEGNDLGDPADVLELQVGYLGVSAFW